MIESGKWAHQLDNGCIICRPIVTAHANTVLQNFGMNVAELEERGRRQREADRIAAQGPGPGPPPGPAPPGLLQPPPPPPPMTGPAASSDGSNPSLVAANVAMLSLGDVGAAAELRAMQKVTDEYQIKKDLEFLKKANDKFKKAVMRQHQSDKATRPVSYSLTSELEIVDQKDTLIFVENAKVVSTGGSETSDSGFAVTHAT